jgi:hypothetical protein
LIRLQIEMKSLWKDIFNLSYETRSSDTLRKINKNLKVLYGNLKKDIQLEQKDEDIDSVSPADKEELAKERASDKVAEEKAVIVKDPPVTKKRGRPPKSKVDAQDKEEIVSGDAERKTKTKNAKKLKALKEEKPYKKVMIQKKQLRKK